MEAAAAAHRAVPPVAAPLSPLPSLLPSPPSSPPPPLSPLPLLAVSPPCPCRFSAAVSPPSSASPPLAPPAPPSSSLLPLLLPVSSNLPPPPSPICAQRRSTQMPDPPPLSLLSPLDPPLFSAPGRPDSAIAAHAMVGSAKAIPWDGRSPLPSRCCLSSLADRRCPSHTDPLPVYFPSSFLLPLSPGKAIAAKHHGLMGVKTF